MAVLGILCLLAACVLAGMAVAPVFNRFMPDGKARLPTSGCGWLVPAVALAAFGVGLLFNVPTQEQRDTDQWNDARNTILNSGE